MDQTIFLHTVDLTVILGLKIQMFQHFNNRVRENTTLRAL